MSLPLIYLDNAATTWPKPPEVAAAVARFMAEVGANPGRAGHRLAVEAAREVYRTREALAAVLGAPDPMRVVFTLNATEALNLALFGWLRPGDHVVTTAFEHNAIMRPLRELERRGVALSVVACEPRSVPTAGDIRAALRRETTLVVATHASNVTGAVLPIRDIGAVVRDHGALFLVDAAQTAGAWPIDVRADRIDLLAVSGHKALYGPMGTGALVIGERVDTARLLPLKRGGTGSRSEWEEQPDFLPDRYESGTLNAAGLAGLGAGVRWVAARGVEAIRSHETRLARLLLDGLAAIPGTSLYGPAPNAPRVGVVSFNIEGMEPSEVGLRLDEEFGALCRIGLHCAPAAHRTLGTYPRGAVRFGLGALSTPGDVDAALDALRRIARTGR